MFEKVNPAHPDKCADRIAGAVVDLCYTKNKDPKVACEVLIGHGEANIQAETSEQISAEDCAAEVSSSDLRRIVKGGPQPTHKIDLVHALLDALYGFDLAEGRVSE